MTLDELILSKLDDLCSRIAKLEEKFDSYFIKKKNNNKTKKDVILITIAVVSTITAIYSTLT